jgi:hypothetical protein
VHEGGILITVYVLLAVPVKYVPVKSKAVVRTAFLNRQLLPRTIRDVCLNFVLGLSCDISVGYNAFLNRQLLPTSRDAFLQYIF